MANMKQAFAAIGVDIKTLRAADEALTALLAKVGSNEALQGLETPLLDTLNTLKETVEGLSAGSVTEERAGEIAAEKVAALVDNAPENLNTLSELAAQIQTNEGGVAGLLATIGSLESLVTGDKLSLVNAINEVKGLADGAQAAAEAAQQAADAAAQAAAEDKVGDLSTLTTTAKDDVVAALNEVAAAAAEAKQAGTDAIEAAKTELNEAIEAVKATADKAAEDLAALTVRVETLEADASTDFLKAYTDARDGVEAEGV